MKKYIVLTILLVALIVTGVVLIVFLNRSEDEFVKNITLEKDGVTQEELQFSANGLAPGGSREYTLNLKSDIESNYLVDITFTEEKDGGLRNFIVVTLECGDYSKSVHLSDLFNGETFSFECEIGTAATAIRIVYSMPVEVGDEAQGTDSDFTVTLNAERL